MSNKKIIGIVVGVAVAIIAVATIALTLANRITNVGGLADSTAHFSSVGNMGTSGAMLLTANVSAQVLATSSSREYAKISNLSGAAIFCNADADKAATANSGIMIAASSSMVMDQVFPYTGAIRCISPGQNASTSEYARQGN